MGNTAPGSRSRSKLAVVLEPLAAAGAHTSNETASRCDHSAATKPGACSALMAAELGPSATQPADSASACCCCGARFGVREARGCKSRRRPPGKQSDEAGCCLTGDSELGCGAGGGLGRGNLDNTAGIGASGSFTGEVLIAYPV
jgi:hypothetical protein